MNLSDKRFLGIFFVLFLVATFLDSGPLRTYLETYLVLSLIPGFLTAISLSELVGSGIDMASPLFYIKLMWIGTSGYLTAILYKWVCSWLTKRQRWR